jgi:glycosyltransferase involved in cell wall biosynthesis
MPQRLFLFFSYNVSLAQWIEQGLFSREIAIYRKYQRQGWRVTLVTWGGKEDLSFSKELAGIEIIPLFTRLPRFKNPVLKLAISFLGAIILHRGFSTATILKTNQQWGAWFPLLVSRLTGIPCVVRCGYEYVQNLSRSNAPRAVITLLHILFRRILKQASHIIVTTADIKQYMLSHYRLSPEHITIIPNYVDTSIFKNDHLARIGDSAIFVGRLSLEKNLKNIISAFAETSWQLTIVGDGPQREELENHACACSAHVNFCGRMPNTALPALLNLHEVSITCSHYEGNPKALLEAMACGCAILGSNVIGIRSIIQDGKQGSICETDAVSIRHSLSRLFLNSKNMGQAGIDLIASTYSLDAVFSSEEEVMRHLSR